LEAEKESKGGLQMPGKYRVIFKAPSKGKYVLGNMLVPLLMFISCFSSRHVEALHL